MKRNIVGLCGLLLGMTMLANSAHAGWFWHPAWKDHYFIPYPARTHAPELPTRPRAEYAPAIVTASDPGRLSTRVPAYTRPPATVYGPAVAAPGPGVYVHGPNDNGLDMNDPFSQRPCVYDPAYWEPSYRFMRPVRCSPEHPLH